MDLEVSHSLSAEMNVPVKVLITLGVREGDGGRRRRRRGRRRDGAVGLVCWSV